MRRLLLALIPAALAIVGIYFVSTGRNVVPRVQSTPNIEIHRLQQNYYLLGSPSPSPAAGIAAPTLTPSPAGPKKYITKQPAYLLPTPHPLYTVPMGPTSPLAESPSESAFPSPTAKRSPALIGPQRSAIPWPTPVPSPSQTPTPVPNSSRTP